MQTAASESGTHTAAWTSTAFFPPETHEDIHICMKTVKKESLLQIHTYTVFNTATIMPGHLRMHNHDNDVIYVNNTSRDSKIDNKEIHERNKLAFKRNLKNRKELSRKHL
jgi:hypothetical protein